MTLPTGLYKIQSTMSGGYLKGFTKEGEVATMMPPTDAHEAQTFRVTKEASGYVVSDKHSAVERGKIPIPDEDVPVVVWGNPGGTPKVHWTIEQSESSITNAEDDIIEDYYIHHYNYYWFDRSDIGFDPMVFLHDDNRRTSWRFIKVQPPY